MASPKPPDDMPLAQAANWYANRVLESSGVGAGAWRLLVRDLLQEAYLAGTRHRRPAIEPGCTIRQMSCSAAEPCEIHRCSPKHCDCPVPFNG